MQALYGHTVRAKKKGINFNQKEVKIFFVGKYFEFYCIDFFNSNIQKIVFFLHFFLCRWMLSERLTIVFLHLLHSYLFPCSALICRTRFDFVEHSSWHSEQMNCKGKGWKLLKKARLTLTSRLCFTLFPEFSETPRRRPDVDGVSYAKHFRF